jgi:hypothetical protein
MSKVCEYLGDETSECGAPAVAAIEVRLPLSSWKEFYCCAAHVVPLSSDLKQVFPEVKAARHTG